MGHYILELALWMLIAYTIGFVIGAILRRVFGSDAVREKPVAPPPPPAEEPVSAAMAEPVPGAETRAPAPPPRMERPRGLAEARGGKADDLQRISGIGPKNEKILHNLGVFHFDQIAAWTADQVSWVDDHLKFNGRIVREKWIEQASLLAAGKEEEFNRRFAAKS